MKRVGLGPKPVVAPPKPVEVKAPAATPVATTPTDKFAAQQVAQTATGPKKTAVVSGLGPGGLLAVLKLAQQGYQVTGVEQRSDYTRHVNISLRQTYLDDVKALSPELHAKLMQIAVPIERNEQVDLTGGKPGLGVPRDGPAPDGPPQTFEDRLRAPKAVNVSIRELEKLFYEHVQGLHDADVEAGRPPSITLERELTVVPTLDKETNTYQVTIKPWKYGSKKDAPPVDLGKPDLLVIAEGGKSTSARAVGMEMQKLSKSKTFVSGHVPESLGSMNRRVNADAGNDKVSVWGTGNTDKGTWLLMEVPESMRLDSPQAALDLFLAGKALLFNPTKAQAEQFRTDVAKAAAEPAVATVEDKPPVYTTGFGGTFQFEQQLMRTPTAGQNVVAMGDTAGMTHADLSGGLELGVHDLKALGTLASAIQRGESRQRAMETYGAEVYQTRLDALTIGMKEFYPGENPVPKELLDLASRLAAAQPDVTPHELLESLLSQARPWAA